MAASKKTKKAPRKIATKAAPKKGPGIIDSIVEFLRKGPITKAGLVVKLAKRFPDRSRGGMAMTVNTQVSRLRKKGFAVVRSEKGYAIN